MSLFAFATHFRICSTSKHFAKHTQNSKPKKSEQDCFQHHTIRAHLCHEISDKKKENTERNNSSAVSSHSSSTPHGTANPLVNSIPLLTACLLLLIARKETARGYVLRREIIGQAFIEIIYITSVCISQKRVPLTNPLMSFFPRELTFKVT